MPTSYIFLSLMVPDGACNACREIRDASFARFMPDLVGPWGTHAPQILGSKPSHLVYIIPFYLVIYHQTSPPALQVFKAFFLLCGGFSLVNPDSDEPSGSG